jgi:hypothetical protein
MYETSRMNAAAGGHLEVLKWLREEGCPWDADACACAARGGGQMEVLRWARANGCPWKFFQLRARRRVGTPGGAAVAEAGGVRLERSLLLLLLLPRRKERAAGSIEVAPRGGVVHGIPTASPLPPNRDAWTC